jgi:tetratricopeptide (TPR) repeat protein
MIIDNADDTEMFFGSNKQATSQKPEGTDKPNLEGNLRRYIPDCSRGSILITTRNKQAAVKLTKNHGLIETREMDPAESSQLIRRKLEDDDLDPIHVGELTTRLENLPLALAQAAAFIQENSITVSKYLQLLDQSDNGLVELLSQPFQEVGRDSSIPNAVTATWVVSFKQIKEQYPHAADLLSLMSFFDRQGIPKLFLSHASALNHNEVGRRHPNQGQNSLELEKALGILKAFSFITEDKTENLNMHRLVQLVIRRWLLREGKSREWASKALLTVSALYPYGETYENWTVCRSYLPHGSTVLRLRESLSTKEFTEESFAESRLLHNVAAFMRAQGQTNEAEEQLKRAVKINSKVFGLEHPYTLSTICNLACTFSNQGRWKEAEELQAQVLETSKRIPGLEHPYTLIVMGNLALMFSNQGRWKEAEELQAQVLETRKRILGLDWSIHIH